MHPSRVIHSDFLNDLGDDFVAVNQAGHVISRASTRASLEQATKNLGEPVHIFSAADFAQPSRWSDEVKPEPTVTSEEPTPFDEPKPTDVEVKPTAKKAAPKK